MISHFLVNLNDLLMHLLETSIHLLLRILEPLLYLIESTIHLLIRLLKSSVHFLFRILNCFSTSFNCARMFPSASWDRFYLIESSIYSDLHLFDLMCTEFTLTEELFSNSLAVYVG